MYIDQYYSNADESIGFMKLLLNSDIAPSKIITGIGKRYPHHLNVEP